MRTLFARSIPLLVQVESQICNVYSSGALLARFKSGDRQLDLPGEHLALEYKRREVREIVSAYLVAMPLYWAIKTKAVFTRDPPVVANSSLRCWGERIAAPH